MKHIISLGAGVQSSTMALMSERGELKPKPTAAIFADTQAEPANVYTWLGWLETQLSFPVFRVTKGSLAQTALHVRTSAAGNYYTKAAIPAFIIDPSKKVGLMMRQCTSDFKITVIHREIRRLRENKERVIQWIGISLDEAHRMKASRVKYIENYYPLIEARMTRNDCLEWMREKGYPAPPRSSCVFCPYHNDNEWRRLKTEQPDGFDDAVKFEKQYQISMSQVSNFRGIPFLHRSCVPLDQIDFDKPTDQPSLFGNECEGVCGV